MSTLSLSVIALVAVVIGAVILFNFWQSRVNRREAERLFRQETGVLDEQAGIARRRRQSFSRPPSDDQTPGDDAVTVPLYADGGYGTGQRTEPSLRDEADGSPALVTDRHGAMQGAEPMVGGRDVRPVPATDAAAAPRSAAPPAPDEGAESTTEPPESSPIAIPEGVDPDQRETLSRYADDLRRITERMPLASAPPMSAKASVAPTADPGAIDPEATFPARDALPPMAVSPAAAAVFLGDETPDPAAAADPAFGADVAQDTGDGAADVSPAPLNATSPAPPQSAEVDFSIVLEPSKPVNADRLIAVASSLRHAGSKPVRLEIDRGDGAFVPLQSGVMANRLQLSVLLANRQGPLNAVELSDFMSALATFARQIGATFTPPDLNQVLGRARAVDSLAAELDTQVEIFVECPERLSPAQFATLGRRLDLYDRGGSRFACLNDGGEVLYLMTPGDRPGLVRFTLDVPRVTVDNDPWRSLVNCATRCAESVGGRVIDSEGRGLSVGMIDAVARQLDRRHDELANAGLAAGSTTALRVFN